MNITRIDHCNDGNDFVIEGKHARMSYRKVAEITMTTHQTVSNWTGKLTDVNKAENIIDKGFSGGELKDFVTYLALDAKRISDEVRNHNIKLLADASDYGFQMLIDKMAGIEFKATNSSELSLDEAKTVLDLVLGYATYATPEEKTQMVINSLNNCFPNLANLLNPIQAQARIATANDNIPLTPTQLGEKIGLSARKINKMLIDKGFQVKNDEAKSRREPDYLLTDTGKEFGKYVTSTGKSGDNTLYQQLRWYESVLAEL